MLQYTNIIYYPTLRQIFQLKKIRKFITQHISELTVNLDP